MKWLAKVVKKEKVEKVVSNLLTYLKTIRSDYYMHFAISVLLTTLLALILPQYMVIIIVLALGIGKEWFDYQDYGKFDLHDLAADILGILIGCL